MSTGRLWPYLIAKVVPEQPYQRQDSLHDQLVTVRAAAIRLGCCDAADVIWERLLKERTPEGREQ